MDELKPCPFCGGEASAEGRTRYSDNHEAWFADGTRITEAFFCNCKTCGSSNQGLCGHQTRDLAIAAWNRRSPPSAPRAEAVEATPELGDTVRHIPSGEQWLVAYIKDGKLSACGWPDERVPAGDCVLVSRMPLRKKLDLLRDLSRSTGHRADYARSLLESAYLTVGAAIAQGTTE